MKIDTDTLDASPVTLAAARAEFDAAVTYLDTATFGLPPRRSWAALQQALAQWRAGTAQAAAYDLPLAAARSSYARLAGVDPSVVAAGSQVSVFAGLIAANLPGGSEVLTATGDFTSILFPFYAQSGRGIRIREVPLDRIAESITSRTTLVAVSAVQSADGAGRRSRCPARRQRCHRGPGCSWTRPSPSGGCRWTRAASPTPPAADTNGCSPPEAPPTSPSIPC
jgi:selenocysteine lyase/cysteine desulfurase